MIELYHPAPPYDARVESMMAGVGGFPGSDRDIFLAGYSELCRADLDGGHALEICGGFGKLAAGLAGVFPGAKVTGLDRYAPTGPEVEAVLEAHPNLEYLAGDAFDLSRFEDESLDLVWGQAALHHLAHDADKLAAEVLRVLKPGGRLVFIFEPLGHNLFVAAVRAVRMARGELPDESNLYFSQFEKMGGGFSEVRVQVFNLLGYPMKALSDRLAPVSEVVRTIDARLMKWFPKLKRYAANCNVVFVK